jgi:hypothetical protein
MSSLPRENTTWIVAALQHLGNQALFRRDAPSQNTKETIGWRETRRISYNLIVGGVGIATCVVIFTIGAAASIFFNSDFGLPNPFLGVFGVIFYGVMANLCFTGGWITELLVRRSWPEEADRFATTAFSLGLAFSVLLTLVPAIIIGVVGFFMLVKHILHGVHG